MAEPNPLEGLLQGKLRTYAEEAFQEYRRGSLRGCYDLLMLTLNTTLARLRPEGTSLFERLSALARAGRIEPEVVDYARSLSFLHKQDRGITDMDLSYLKDGELFQLVSFLETYFRSLGEGAEGLSLEPGRDEESEH